MGGKPTTNFFGVGIVQNVGFVKNCEQKPTNVVSRGFAKSSLQSGNTSFDGSQHQSIFPFRRFVERRNVNETPRMGGEESPRGRWVAVAVPKAPSSWSATEWVQLFAEEAGVCCRQRLRRNSRLRNLGSVVVFRVTRSEADGYPKHHGAEQGSMPAAEDAKAECHPISTIGRVWVTRSGGRLQTPAT